MNYCRELFLTFEIIQDLLHRILTKMISNIFNFLIYDPFQNVIHALFDRLAKFSLFALKIYFILFSLLSFLSFL